MLSMRIAQPGSIENVSEKIVQECFPVMNRSYCPQIDTSIIGARAAVIRAVKFIVSGDLLQVTNADNPEQMRSGLEQITDVFDVKIEDLYHCNTAEDILRVVPIRQRIKLFEAWSLYSTKLPYPCIFIENEYGGILLEQVGGMDGPIFGRVFAGNCELFPAVFEINSMIFELSQKGKMAPFFMHTSQNIDSMPDVKSGIVNDRNKMIRSNYKGIVTSFVSSVAFNALRIITFLHCRNLAVSDYKPKKSELPKKMPDVIKKQFEYKILRITKERKVYGSMDDIRDSTRPGRDGIARGHMVRGHPKTRKTGVFFWSPHHRGDRTKGVIEKDYIVES